MKIELNDGAKIKYKMTIHLTNGLKYPNNRILNSRYPTYFTQFEKRKFDTILF